MRAVASVESSGHAFWSIDGELKPVIRLEAHWFGKLTGYAGGLDRKRWLLAHEASARLFSRGIPRLLWQAVT